MVWVASVPARETLGGQPEASRVYHAKRVKRWVDNRKLAGFITLNEEFYILVKGV